MCVRGVCSCELDWSGVDCSEPRRCLNDCHGNGLCKYGRCYCGPGYDGPDCSIPLGCVDDGHCSGHGICSQGRCFCDPGYFGKNCSFAIECPHDCGGTGQGVCAQGRCFCHTGWEGEDCTTPAKCPADSDGVACSGRGTCMSGMCVCEPGYTGDLCELEQTCPYGCHSQGECWGGRCLCFPGFEGEDCSNVVACVEDCSSHGTCVHGMCFCDLGFGGAACELVIPCPNGCSHHGICQHSRCFCDPGYGGDDCSLEVHCPVSSGLECAGRGVCVGGACVCVAGIGGIDCSQVLAADSPLAVLHDEVRRPTRAQREAYEYNVNAATSDGMVEYRTQPVSRAHLGSRSRRLLFASSRANETGAAVSADGEAGAPPEEAVSPSPCAPGFGGADCLERLEAPSDEENRTRELLLANYRANLTEADRSQLNGLIGLTLVARAKASRPSPRTSAGVTTEAVKADVEGEEEEGEYFHVEPVTRAWTAHNPKRRLLFATQGPMPAPASFLELSSDSGPALVEPGSTGGFVPAFTHRTAQQQADGLAAAVTWPSEAAKAKLMQKARQTLEKSVELRANSTPSPAPPPSFCKAGCNLRGVCWEGQCFCDPGWDGDDCSVEQKCKEGCEEHGVCQYGLCFCDLGWEGPACETAVPCPGDCNGHGTCWHARCECKPGWSGEDCATPVAIISDGCDIGFWTAILVQIPVALVGFGIGWGIKYANEARQRAKMREILQQDAQRPFASG